MCSEYASPSAVWAGPYRTGVPPAVAGQRYRRLRAEALQYINLPMLLRYADRSAMAFGREVRLPYLDPELVDFCIGLPDRAFIQWGWQKYILRRAAEGSVAQAIQWRADKVGFQAPFDHWLRGPLKIWAQERLFDGGMRALPGYERGKLEETWQQHQAGSANTVGALWRWLSAGEWTRILRANLWRTR
jgi:asparagine synthase (glutamine-hydrolysing)